MSRSKERLDTTTGNFTELHEFSRRKEEENLSCSAGRKKEKKENPTRTFLGIEVCDVNLWKRKKTRTSLIYTATTACEINTAKIILFLFVAFSQVFQRYFLSFINDVTRVWEKTIIVSSGNIQQNILHLPTVRKTKNSIVLKVNVHVVRKHEQKTMTICEV